jgi:DNA-binding NtrC family response regulator
LLTGAHGIDAVVLDATVRSKTAVSLALHVKDLQLPLVMISGSPAAIEFADTNGLQLLSKPLRMDDLFVALAKALASGEFGQRDAEPGCCDPN